MTMERLFSGLMALVSILIYLAIGYVAPCL